MSDKYRSRNFLLLLYPEDPTHAEAMKRLDECGFQYAAILHDKDTWEEGEEDFDPAKHTPGEVKKAHWHVVVKFLNPRWDTALAKELGIKTNYIWECKDLNDRLLYLVHAKHPAKYQYDYDAVFGPLKPSLQKLLDNETEDERMLRIVDMIDDEPGKVSARAMLRKLGANGLYGEARRMGYLLKWLVEEHNAEFYMQTQHSAGVEQSLNRFNDFVSWTGDKGIDKLPPL